MEAAREQLINDLTTMKMDKIINSSYTMGIDDLLDTAVGGGLKAYDSKIDSVEKEANKAIVTYDGKYIFEIDENLNVIYSGTTDGVAVTATVSGGGGWVKSALDSTVTVSGKIKTTEGTIIEATITKAGGTAENLTLGGDGAYTKAITESGTYTIYAKDSNNKENTKIVEINIQVDGELPEITKVEANYADGKITIVAEATDAKSGIDYLTYSVKEKDGDGTELNTSAGMKSNVVSVTPGKTYEVIVTAYDKAGNSVSSSTIEAKAVIVIPVQFNANGGKFADESTTKIIEAEDGIVTLPTVTQSGKTLIGWYTDATSGEKVGNAGDTYTAISSINLYAHYLTPGRSPILSSSSDSRIISENIDVDISNQWGTFGKFRAFDNNNSTAAAPVRPGTAAAGAWIGLDFGTPIYITNVSGKIRMTGYKIQYADAVDGTWKDAASGTSSCNVDGNNFSNTITNYETLGAHQFWRLYVSSNNTTDSNWSAFIYELVFNTLQ